MKRFWAAGLGLVGLVGLTAPAAAQQAVLPGYQICSTANGVQTCNWQPVATGTPLPVTGNITANLTGFTPTPSYSLLSASDAANHSVAVPTGADDVISNKDTNIAYCNFGAASTTGTFPIPAGAAYGFHNGGAFATVQCQSPNSTLAITVSGGAGLFSGGGGGGGGGGTFSWPGTAGNANWGTTPSGTVPAVSAGAFQQGTWNINNVAGTVSLPTGAATSALQPTNAAQGSTTSGQTGPLVQCAVTTSAPAYSNGQTSPVSCDLSGNVRTSTTATASVNPFTPNGNSIAPFTVNASSGSTDVALPAGAVIQIENTGTNDANFNLGTTGSGGTVATTQQTVAKAQCVTYATVGSNTFIAALTTTGTSTIKISGGTNLGTNYCGGATGIVQQGAAGTPAGAWYQQIVGSDAYPAAINITAADAGSTNTTIANGQVNIAGTPTANSAAVFQLDGVQAVHFQATGGATGQLEVDLSKDGTNYSIAKVVQQGINNYQYTFGTTGNTTNFSGDVNTAGYVYARVRANNNATWSGTEAIAAVETPLTNKNITVDIPVPGNYGPYYSAASNNATVVKASPGSISTITVTQSTTTAMELKLYNLATTPTCSSATGIIDNIPIPSNATSPGFHVTYPQGRAFTAGIGFCLVAFGNPASSTDNGNAVTGATVSITGQ